MMGAEVQVQVSVQDRQMSKQSVQTAEQLKQEGNQAFKGGAIRSRRRRRRPLGRRVAQPPLVSAATQTSTMHTRSSCTARR